MQKQSNQRLPLFHSDISEQVQQYSSFHRGKTADLIHSLMIQSTDSKPVSQTSLKVMKAIQNDSVENQILGIASLLLVFLDRYGLSHIDVLGMADGVVYSGESNNMLTIFRDIIKLMRTKKEILN